MKDDLQTEAAPARRIASVDALRGLVIFTMICVNDIAGVDSRIVPGWMRHFQGPSGMTFVDLVFPAFLFIVGMSVPLALNARLARGEPLSEMHGSALDLLGLGGWYSRLAQPDLAHAMARSIGCAIVILAITAGINRIGFRLKL